MLCLRLCSRRSALTSSAAAGVCDRVTVVHGNALGVCLRDATVVFLYLLPRGNARLAAKLTAELTPGTRVLTHMFRRATTAEARESALQSD